MCICTYTKVQWNFSFNRKWWDMNCWGDRALGMSQFPPNSVKGDGTTWLPNSGLAQRSIFFFPSLPQKTKCKRISVGAIPKQAPNELTLELEAIKLLQTEVTPELIAQVQCHGSEAMLLQVIVNLPAQGCLTYCFIVIFRHSPNESSKSQKISKLKLFGLFYIITCGTCIAVAFLIMQ